MPDENSPDQPPMPGDGPASGAEADDEFAGLAPTPPRRSPIVAAAVIAVGGILLHHLADDTRYALGRGAPVAIGDARAVDFAALADNTAVAVRGLPDYRNALLFEPKGDSYRRAFFRMLGTDSRLVVRADQTHTRFATDGRIVGRLRRFDALPWAEQIRAYYATRVKASRTLELGAFAAATGTWAVDKPRPSSLPDTRGEPVALDPKTELAIVVSPRGRLIITMSRDRFAVEEDARHEAERLGRPVRSLDETKEGFRYSVDALPDVNGYIAKLEAAAIAFQSYREEVRVPWEALSGRTARGAMELVVPGRAEAIPIDQVSSVQLESPIAIPPDAWVVVENELPADFQWVLFLDGALVLFLGFNLWLLTRSLRGRKTASP